jgi:hypothetical protein
MIGAVGTSEERDVMWRAAAARADEALRHDDTEPWLGSAEARSISGASRARPVVPEAHNDGPGEAVARLRRGLEEFRSAHRCSVQSAQRAITPLLDVWALASEVDHMAARPVEILLTALVAREVVTADELSHCADEVDWAVSWLAASQ